MKFALPLAVLAFAASAPLAAGTEMPVEVARSETLPLAPDGTVRIDRTWGDVEVEAWDQPAVEVAVSARSKKSYDAADAAEGRTRLQRFGFEAKATAPGEVAVTGVSPSASLLRPFGGKSGVTVRYAIKVPRRSNLVLHHEVGDVKVAGVEGDVDVANDTGEVTLRLPLDADVAVETSSSVGDADLNAELRARGTFKRRSLVGHSFRYQPAAPDRHVKAHVGVGTVTID